MNKTLDMLEDTVRHVLKTPNATVLVAISRFSPLPNVMSARFLAEMRRPWVKLEGFAISVDRQRVDPSCIRMELDVASLDGPSHKATVIFQRMNQDHQLRGYEPSLMYCDELNPPEFQQLARQQAGRRLDGEKHAKTF